MSTVVHPSNRDRIPCGSHRPKPAYRPSVGIALSSGGAKGLAHVGVIQVLEENGIAVDAIAGTSMGAYVGSLWASGLDGAQLEGLAAEVNRPRDLLSRIDPVLPPRRGFIRGHKIRRRLQRSLGDSCFGDMRRSLFVVATDALDFSRRVFNRGPVLSAVMASLAIPGIIVPVRRGGRHYVDGGISEPIPIRALRERFAPDLMIAVDVLPTLAELHADTGTHSEREPMPLWKRVLHFLNRHLNYFARGNLLDTMRRSTMGAQIRIVEHCAAAADILIRPTAPSLRWHDYSNWAAYIENGRAAATAALPEIGRQIARLKNSITKSNPHPLIIQCT
jgi:NTE family protein